MVGEAVKLNLKRPINAFLASAGLSPVLMTGLNYRTNDMNDNKKLQLPYFNYLLSELKRENSRLEQSFGRHVHWGYWENPDTAALTAQDFAKAAEALSAQICRAGLIRNNLCVLDAGCGFGGTVAHINENYRSMSLMGVNLDERQLTRAKEQVKPVPGNRIDFKQSDACALPFDDASFDAVLAVECIFHFPSRERFFKEAYRVLKPGGYLALSDFVPKPLLKPIIKLKMLEWGGAGFYGKCDFSYCVADYLRLAQTLGLDLTVERDITANTLPTYRYLRRLNFDHPVNNPFAYIETAVAEVFSRMRLLDYYIFSFRKPV